MPFPINEHRNLLARAEFTANQGRLMADLELRRGSIEAGASAIQDQREGIRDTLEAQGLGDYTGMFPADRSTAWNLARAGDLLRPVLEADMRSLAKIRELAAMAFVVSTSGASGGSSRTAARNRMGFTEARETLSPPVIAADSQETEEPGQGSAGASLTRLP